MTRSKLSKAQGDALASLANDTEVALYGFAVKPSGFSRATMTALVGKGMVTIAKVYEGSGEQYISGHFGRIAHTKRFTYIDIRYALTDAGKSAINLPKCPLETRLP